MIPRRSVISSYQLYEQVKVKYPLRDVKPTPEVDNGTFLFIGKTGKVYTVHEDGSVYGNYSGGYYKIWPRDNPPRVKFCPVYFSTNEEETAE